MFPRVTAILVVQHGGDRLRETLDALAAQRRTPDALAVVLMRPDQATRDAVASAHPSHVVQVEEPLPGAPTEEAPVAMKRPQIVR